MSDLNQKILELINSESSVKEIMEITGLSYRQLSYRLNLLKIKGYDFSRKYYYSGDIVYKLVKGLQPEEKDFALITSPTDKRFRAIFLSDLHFSNPKERLDLLNKVYDYCIKENIHIIINAGDLIDAFIGPDPKLHDTYEKQIEYMINNYPFDSNILNFTCLGNHDLKSITHEGLDVAKVLFNKRLDIVPIGYGMGILNVKNDQIIVKHRLDGKSNKTGVLTNKLILYGHEHRMKFIIDDNVKLFLPTLSDLKLSSDELLPGIVKAEINFSHGYFNDAVFEQLFVTQTRFYKANEFHINLLGDKNISGHTVKYEEDRESIKNKQLVLTKETKGENRVDKFNKKYGDK